MQTRQEPKLIPVGIDYGHITKPFEALARGILHPNASALKLRVPIVDVGNIKVNEAPDLAVSRMLREIDGHPVTADLHENRQMRFESVFPVDFEPKPFDVERLAPGVVGDS
jgi:hypothetical protein